MVKKEMIIEEFKMIFCSPEYKISCKKIEVKFDKISRFGTYVFRMVGEDGFYEFENSSILRKRGNISSYNVFLMGENNMYLAKKYFLNLFRKESVKSELHMKRYLTYKDSFFK